MKQIPFTNKTADQLVSTYGLEIGVQAVYLPAEEFIIPVIGIYKDHGTLPVYLVVSNITGTIEAYNGTLSGIVFVP